MFVKYILVQAMCVVLCLASSLSESNEELLREYIEHVPRIPNPDKVLNSVLGKLQRNRQQLLARSLHTEDDDCESTETERHLPEYTESLQGSRERGVRQLGVQKHYPICHLERKIRRLNTNEYEYRPAYYEEVRCMSPRDEIGSTNEVCSSLGFSCIQWNKTIHLTRRRYSSDCWETRTMVIPAGCECMWPVHRLGDITLHV